MKKLITVIVLLLISSLSFAQSFTEIKKNAEQGDAQAQCNLGDMYL